MQFTYLINPSKLGNNASIVRRMR